MVNENLVIYIKSTLAKGYSPESIKSRLVASGYPVAEVEEAIRKATRKVNVKLILGIAALVVIVILVVLGLILVLRPLFSGEETVAAPVAQAAGGVSLSLQTTLKSLKPGDDLSFSIGVTNLGTAVKEIEINSFVLDVMDNQILRKSEKETLGTKINREGKFSIPLELEPGDYVLKVTVIFDGEEEEETVDFKVVGAGVTETATVDESKEIEMIVKMAQTDFVKAKELCLNEIQLVENQDNCLLRAGREARKTSLCDAIRDNEKRDTCYLDLALNLEDYSVCDKITNVYSRQACSALAG